MHQQTNEVTSGPDSNRNLKIHLTYKCLEELIWIMARELTLEGTAGKVNADKKNISGKQVGFLVLEIKAFALSLTWLNSIVVSRGEKEWCRLIVQLLHRFLFGVQNFSWEKRSELYMTWQENGNSGREVCGQGKGPNMNYSNKVKKQWVHSRFFHVDWQQSCIYSMWWGLKLNRLQWQPLEKIVPT